MAPYIDAWFALTLVIIGLSHAAQPRLWAEFFNAMKQTGFAPLIIGMYTLPTGLVILLGHNIWVWSWPVWLAVNAMQAVYFDHLALWGLFVVQFVLFAMSIRGWVLWHRDEQQPVELLDVIV